MLHLMKIFLALCVSAMTCGCSFFATLYGEIAYYGYQLYQSSLVLPTDITVEQPIGFATLSGHYNLLKADSNAGALLPTDEFCISFGTYTGYKGEDGTFVAQSDITTQALENSAGRTYDNVWGTLHAGKLLGGEYSTDYKNYFAGAIVGINAANLVRQSEGTTQDGVLYEVYSYKDAVMGLDYMLKLYYTADRTGVVYLYGERNYTISTAPLWDDFDFVNIDPSQSYPLDSVIASYVGGNDGGSLFDIDSYEGAWDDGHVWIDGIEYNLRAENLRVLESAGVMPFDDKFAEFGYDTPTKGGSAEVNFAFGHRVLKLKLEYSSITDATLRDARIVGFSTDLSNNIVTDDDLAKGSYGIHPNGEVVDEQTFVETYFGGVPYVVASDSGIRFFDASGNELTEEEYNKLMGYDTASESENTASASENSASENSASENSASENSASENSASENSASETVDPGNGAFASVGESSAEDEEVDLSGDWFVIGGLHTEVTLPSLESYLKTYATSYSTMGSGNAITYTVTHSESKMIFVLEKSTTITSMEVWY